MLGQYGKDLPYYVLSKGSAVVSWIFIVWLLTHKLNPQQYGEYALLFSLLTLLTIVSTSWLNSSIYRHLPEHAEADDLKDFQAIILRLTAITICLGLAAGVVIIGIMVALGLVGAPPLALLSVAVAFVGNCAFVLVTAYLSAKRAVRQFAAASAGQVVLFGAALWLVLDHFDQKSAVIFFVMTLSYLPTLLLAGSRTARHPIAIAARARQYMRYGLPLMLMSSATLINMYGDQFVIRYFTSSVEVGLYSANYMFAERAILSLASVMTIAYLPILFRMWERGDQTGAYGFIWKIVFLLLTALVPIEILLCIFGDQIAAIFIDASFSSASVIIPVVGLATILVQLAGAFADALTLQKRTLTLAACYGVAAIVNLVLNFYLIPYFGYLSAAYATLVSSAFLLIMVMAAAQYYASIFQYLRPNLLWKKLLS
jgi:O-antigen/teichoic acid export membrane protein